MSKFFLPSNLSPQGWLTDILLGQIQAPDNDRLRRLIYDGHPQRKVDKKFKHANGKLFSLNAYWKNTPEAKLHTVATSTLGSWFSSVSNWLGEKGVRWNPRQKYVDFMMSMTPAQQAALIPYMRIFVRTRKPAAEGVKKNKNPWAERDIVFKEFVDEKFILENEFARVGSAGIKNIKAERKFPGWGKTFNFFFDIEYYFSSMVTFTKGHTSDILKGQTTRDYIKLIEPPGTKTKCMGSRTIDVLEEELMLEYGWRFDQNAAPELVPLDVRYAFEQEERKVFNIRWVRHDFQFQENGEISLNVKYQGIPDYLVYEDVEENNILRIEDMALKYGFDREQAVLREKYNSIKVLKEESKRLTNYLNDCGGTLASYQESLSESERAIEREALADIQKGANKRLGEVNKEIRALKIIISSKASQAMLVDIAKNNQLFRVGFSSGADKAGNYHFHMGFRPVRVLEDVEKIASGAQALLKENYVDNLISEGDLWMPGISGDSLSEIIKQKFNKDDVIRALNAKIAGPADETTKHYKKIKEQADAAGAVSDDERIRAILCALTNCGHGAPRDLLGQGHPEKTYGNFFFFPLRALISTAFNIVDEKFAANLPIICLGNMVTRSLGKEYWVNIGDILIEVHVFQKWFYRNVIAPGRTKWPFGQFMDSIMEELVPIALTGHPSDQFAPPTNFGPITKESLEVPHSWNKKKKTSGGDGLIAPKGLMSNLTDSTFYDILNINPDYKHVKAADAILAHKTFGDFLSEIKKDKKSTGSHSLFYYRQYATTSVTETEAASPLLRDMGQRTFNRMVDHGDGMYHLVVGEDKGPLKKIDFKYIDNSALRTALWLDKYVDGVSQFLKQPYEATPTMVGNNLFFKGAFFVVPVNPLGIEDEDDPGIRGYYRIDSVTDLITMGEYTTSVHGVNMGHNFSKKQLKKPGGKAKAKKAVYGTHVQHNVVDYMLKNLFKDFNFVKKYFGLSPGAKEAAAAAASAPPAKSAAEIAEKAKERCAQGGATYEAATKACKCDAGYTNETGKCTKTSKAKKKKLKGKKGEEKCSEGYHKGASSGGFACFKCPKGTYSFTGSEGTCHKAAKPKPYKKPTPVVQKEKKKAEKLAAKHGAKAKSTGAQQKLPPSDLVLSYAYTLSQKGNFKEAHAACLGDAGCQKRVKAEAAAATKGKK